MNYIQHIFIILFILNNIYYLLNRTSLNLTLSDRTTYFRDFYKKKHKIFSDILYFFSEAIYPFWLFYIYFIGIINTSKDMNFALILATISVLNWILKNNSPKVDYAFTFIKLLVLFTFLVSS